MRAYPTELVEKAIYELHIFERVSGDTAVALIEEVKRLRELLKSQSEGHSHKCIACYYSYTPKDGDSEDCPVCGCDGTPTRLFNVPLDVVVKSRR